MGKRKGNKTKKKTGTALGEGELDTDKRVPKTLVFRRSNLGFSAAKLLDDLRGVMLPFTAPHLKEKKSNVLKDFVSVAGPLGISHFMILSATDLATYLRVARAPQGPTLTFRVTQYSLASDVRKIQRNPHSPGNEFKTSPLLVLSGFNVAEPGKHHELMKVTFREMFPALSVNQINLDDCRRVVLLNYDQETDTVEFRHYVINTAPVGLNKSIKRVVQNKVQDLSKYQDIADYVLSGTGDAESDAEDDGSSHVSVSEKSKNQKKDSTSTKSIRLQEIGPRLRMELIKIEEHLCEGTVWYHKFVEKTEEEKKALEERKAREKALKEKRKRDQEQRVQQKKSKGGGEGEADEDDPYGNYDEDHDDEIANADAENEEGKEEEENENITWYRNEVGEEPDQETADALKAVKVDSGGERIPKGFGKKKSKDGDNKGQQGKQGGGGGAGGQQAKGKKRSRDDDKGFKKYRPPNKKHKK